MNHLSFSPNPQGHIKARVKLALCTLAAGLSTRPLHGDQAATKKRVFMNDLGEAGSSPAFWIGQVSSAFHRDHLLVLIYLLISEQGGLSTKSLNANLLKMRRLDLTR
jgi:hypothetical protein